MANDSFDININGLAGAGGGPGGIDTTAFQDALSKLTSNLKDAGNSVSNYTTKMKDAEQKLSASIKTGLGSTFSPTAQNATNKVLESAKNVGQTFDTKFINSVDRLINSLDKLSTGMKSSPGGDSPEKTLQQVKTLFASVGIGSIVKSLLENNLVNPAKNAGYLISSNVLQNPAETASNLVASTLQAQANTTTAIATIIGGAVGGALGGLPGAAIGGGIAGNIANTFGQYNNATRIPTAARLFQQSFENNYTSQNPRLQSLMNSTYGGQDLNSAAVYADPSRANNYQFNRAFSRFSTQNVDTSSIVQRLSTAGFGTPGESSQFGNLLGQIAKFTGKNSEATNNIVKNIEKSGVNPFDQAQKALNLFQAGLSASQVNSALLNTANQTSVFSQAQQNFYGQSPIGRLQSDLGAQVFGIDAERYAQGDKATIQKVNRFRTGANLYNSTHGRKGNIMDVIVSSALSRLGIVNTPTGGNDVIGGASLNQSAEEKRLKEIATTANKNGLDSKAPLAALSDYLNDLSKSASDFAPAINNATSALDVFSYNLRNGILGETTRASYVPQTFSQKGGK